MVIQVITDLDDHKEFSFANSDDLIREKRRRMLCWHSPLFFSFMIMTDENEKKAEDSETDYGSDSWLVDFDVDRYVAKVRAAERHNREYERNPYYRLRFNGGKVWRRHDLKIDDMRREDKRRMEILKRSEERRKREKEQEEETKKRRRLAFKTPSPKNKESVNGAVTSAEDNVEDADEIASI